MLRVYALAPETLRRMLRLMIWRLLGYTTLSFLIFGVYLAVLSGPLRWAFVLPVTGLIALAYFFILFFTYRQQLRWLYSVRYEINRSSITYRQRGQDPLTVMRADIIGLEERGDGVQITTVPGSPVMFVPHGLANHGDEDLRRTLALWTGGRLPPIRQAARRSPAILMGLGGSLLVLLFANHMLLIIPLGVATVAYGIYTERRMNASLETDPVTTRTYSAAFTLLIFIIMMKACLISMSLMLAR